MATKVFAIDCPARFCLLLPPPASAQRLVLAHYLLTNQDDQGVRLIRATR
jgi:hypothetical protein